MPTARGSARALNRSPLPAHRRRRRRWHQVVLHRERAKIQDDGRDKRVEPTANTRQRVATTWAPPRSADLWTGPKDLGRLRTFSQHHGHLRVDGDRHPKSRPLSSALRGMKALLGLVELNVHLPLRITGTAAPGRRALRRSPEVTGGRGGQEASSCEQPVDGARAGDSAPFAAMSRWKAAHEQGRPSQPTPFSRNSSFLSGS